MSARSKPFQQATVAAATKALTGGNPLRRFLVADEVGLGKTVVARDILAMLAHKASKFTVYYISSGHKVADQNKVELLRFLDEDAADAALSKIDRIGLMPIEEKRTGSLRLYAFTPHTSFSSKKRLYGGKAVERAFIKLLLDELYPGLTSTFPDAFIEHGATTGWEWASAEARRKFNYASVAFKRSYGRALGEEFGKPVCETISQLANDEKASSGHTIGRMRKALAQAALDSARPDLVILDEFQCYRELLDACADNSLARQMLEGKNDSSPPPILLLSATPYRFYAERWETVVGRAPHVELFDLIAFLGGAEVRAETEAQFRRFGDLLLKIGRLPVESRGVVIDEAKTIKHRLEMLLTPLMSRTERPTARERSEPLPNPLRIEARDLDIYRHFTTEVPQRFKAATIAYWLSVPLPAQALGERYQITRGVKFPAMRSIPRLGITTWSRPPKEGWGSAKLRALGDILPTDALALPWMLPSLTWWDPAGPWAKVRRPQKMIIFSRFRATPQSVASLVSLEVERKFVGRSSLTYANAWKKRRLNPKPNQGPTFALFHPSPFLIRAVNPLDVCDGASLKQVRARARKQIIRALPASIACRAPNKRDDSRRKSAWAVLAAIEAAQPFVHEFAAIQGAWGKVAQKDMALQSLLEQRQKAEPISWISKWELEALVDMALGAPGVVAGRALYRHLPELFDYPDDHYRKLAQFCWTKLRTYLDRPVFWSVLPGDDATVKYQRACVEGCLEAVLDEHFWLRKSKVGGIGLIDDLSSALSANVGTFGFKGLTSKERIRIRCHAAVPFGGTESEVQRQDPHQGNENQTSVRSEEIRSAFNTPFWPYVLVTTSVGQEGLDFHSWCDCLGHWDLCSSPVDLEQREGRIQRFGGLTVRRPLADKLGKYALTMARRDPTSPWDAIAKSADEEFKDDETGLTPWWTLPGADLKRHLFVLPQSRDIDRFAKLKTQRLLYRLALGQPDQEDLVELLTDNDAETLRLLQGLALNLSAFAHRKLD